jgi:ADP-dependent NAD(P)H-hydrate dehydratase / NAD(P)H-hydrate epimerase
MKIFRSSQIREIDHFTIHNEPIKSIDLMERAASKITQWIIQHMSNDIAIQVYVGPGNNGGDALVVARQLAHQNFKPEVFIVRISEKLSPDCEINLNRLKKETSIKVIELFSKNDLSEIPSETILIDGIFGSGLTRKPDGLAKETINHINNSKATIISIDIPSGLFGEDNSTNDSESIIKATYTLTLQFPKLSFFLPENEDYIGKWFILPIGLHPEIIKNTKTPFMFVQHDFIKENLKIRKKFSHKGTFGHVLLISGSYGKMGAAILAAKASLRTGSGLVTVHIPKLGYKIMQTALPEAMVSIDESDLIFSGLNNSLDYSSIGIGPGIGTKPNTVKGFTSLLNNYRNPLVIDADALNILSEHNELIRLIPENSILTPHPKEFERLVGKWKNDYERLQVQIEFAVKNKIVVVLKGAHTSIACPNGDCYFNCTGNPGMATAGCGDVLTGIILSLLGQGYEPKFAAIIGVYLHGLAADIAVEKTSQEALIASDIIENLGNAFLKIKHKND